MPRFSTILFFDETTQRSDESIRRLSNLSFAGNLSRLIDGLPACDLVFLQAGGKLRQEAIKLLLKAKKSFALLGLEPADLEDSSRLQRAARKRHIQVCWLGSLRFFPAAARLKELLSGACLGDVQQATCFESLNSPWESYQLRDLLQWLLPENQCPILAQPQEEDPGITIRIIASKGEASIRLQKKQPGLFQLKQLHGPEKHILCSEHASPIELGLLLLLCQQKQPWKILATPWDC
ncbi:MAG: hypothetical protein WCT05_10830 [Lentisphaeria bacterium]